MKTLIIRSASLQQLDKNMPEITAHRQGHELHLLTHGHFIEQCRKYKDVTRVIDYGKTGDFSFRHIPPEIKKEHYDSAVVPVTNLTGAGFLNVLAMALRTGARKIYLCNLVSEITPVSRSRIVLKLIRSGIFVPLSAILSFPLVLFFPIYLAGSVAASMLKRKN